MLHMVSTCLGAATLLAMAAYPGLAAPGGTDPLAPYRWKARVLVAVAPAADNPQLLEQRRLFKTMGQAGQDRDLALLEGVGDESRARALRQALGLDDAGFYAVLIGKDGGAKLTSRHPLAADQLFPVIDAMPIRQGEMKR